MRSLGTGDPRRIGRYRVLAELGRGGMGRVLLGCALDGRLVAIKQVHPLFAEDEGFRARFRSEVKASRKVSGGYTAAVIDADTTGPEPWLATEFIPGPTLHEAIVTAKALPEESVRRLAAGLAAALQAIHSAGVVHRDLKPSNVLLSGDGLRVIDFGIARAADGELSGELTRTGLLVGAPAFMSPEQVQGVRPLPPASDVFALGALLAVACTGKVPFDGPSAPQYLYQVVHTEPDLSAVPESLRHLIGLCLAKEWQHRPTPAQIQETIGQIAPAALPWPLKVHRLIAAQYAKVDRILVSPQDHATDLEPEAAQRARTRLQVRPPEYPDHRVGGPWLTGVLERLSSQAGQLAAKVRKHQLLARLRNTLVVLLGVIAGMWVTADLNGKPVTNGTEVPVSSHLARFADEVEGPMAVFEVPVFKVLDHASYFGAVTGVVLGAIAGGLVFLIGGQRFRMVGRVVPVLGAVSGLVIGRLAESGALSVSAVGVGSGVIEAGVVGVLVGLAVPVFSLLRLYGKRGGIVGLVLMLFTAAVGCVCGMNSWVGVLVDGTVTFELASIVGGAVGAGAALRLISRVWPRRPVTSAT